MPVDPLRVAAFDVDGTLTRRDTLLPFLQRLCGTQRLAMALGRNGLSLARMSIGRADREAVKVAVLLPLLAGRRLDEVAAAGEAYARHLVDHDRLRPEMMARVEEHRARGDRLVMVSASPEVYLGPLGDLLGFDAVLGTRLDVGPDGRLTGRLGGRNCRGPEKVARLDAWLAGRDATVIAYGDSAGDAELLARADVGVRIAPRAPLPPLPPLASR